MYQSRLVLVLVISKIQINFVWSPHTSIPGSTVPGWAHLTPPLHNATNTQQGPAQLLKTFETGETNTIYVYYTRNKCFGYEKF